MPLRRRLLTLISLVLLMCVIIGGVLTYWQGLQKIDLEMSSAIAVGESALVEAAAPLATTSDSVGQVRRLIQSFDGDRHLQARLIARDGGTALASHVRAPAIPAPAWLTALLVGPNRYYSVPLPDGLPVTGALRVETDAMNEIAEVWDDLKLKALLVLGFCGLVLALVYVTLGRALTPLENLSTALARVGDGDYGAHVLESGPQELAVIYKEFNRMAERLAQAERSNQRLNEQLSSVQEEERAEIARDLHDEVGPFLFAVDVDAQTIPPLLARGADADVAARAEAIRQSVGHMQRHIRSILGRLRPATLVDLGLDHASDQLAAFWRARRPTIIFDVDVSEATFGAKLDEAAFRIFQEGTSNAVRHGDPARIALSAHESPPGILRVVVSDDGSGLAAATAKGFGLAGMRERVALLGGKLDVSGNPASGGVTLVAEIPIVPGRAELVAAEPTTATASAP